MAAQMALQRLLLVLCLMVRVQLMLLPLLALLDKFCKATGHQHQRGQIFHHWVFPVLVRVLQALRLARQHQAR